MKGSPLLETLLVTVLLIAAGVPVWKLTRSVDESFVVSVRPEEPEAHAHVQDLEGYLVIRSSHPFQRLQLLQDGKPLVDLAGDDEAELAWTVEHGVVEFETRVEWGPDVDRGYLEMKFEPDGMVSRETGFWGSGVHTQLVEVAWPHHH